MNPDLSVSLASGLAPLSRRSFLTLTAGITLGSGFALGAGGTTSGANHSDFARLFVNHKDWDSPFDRTRVPESRVALEMVGSNETGLELAPRFVEALQWEVLCISGIWIPRDRMHNLDKIDSCGLFAIYLNAEGSWKKFKLWNYLKSNPPETTVTNAYDLTSFTASLSRRFRCRNN